MVRLALARRNTAENEAHHYAAHWPTQMHRAFLADSQLSGET